MFKVALQVLQNPTNVGELKTAVLQVYPDASVEELNRYSANLLRDGKDDLITGVNYLERKIHFYSWPQITT